MADTLGVKLETVEVTWGSAIAALQANKIDTMFVLDATPKRALAVDFPAQPLLYYALAVLGREDLNMENWSDLNKDGIKISVTQGTTMERYLTKYLPKAKILRFPSNGESVAAFQSISPGQWEAGKAIGMTYVQQMRRVILPQAIKRMIPAFTNRGVELTKMTSLASVIAYAELIHQAKTISTMNFNPIETSTIVAIIYFILIYPITLLVRRFEKKANE